MLARSYMSVGNVHLPRLVAISDYAQSVIIYILK